jgi:hypothetical protein
MKKHEVIDLANKHPLLAQRAISMERNAILTSVVGLGRNWKWEDLIKADSEQMRLFEDLPDEIPCGCYDG